MAGGAPHCLFNSVFLKNLSPLASDESVRKFLEPALLKAGESPDEQIRRIQFKQFPGSTQKYCQVDFGTSAGVMAAMSLNGSSLLDVPLVITVLDPASQGPPHSASFSSITGAYPATVDFTSAPSSALSMSVQAAAAQAASLAIARPPGSSPLLPPHANSVGAFNARAPVFGADNLSPSQMILNAVAAASAVGSNATPSTFGSVAGLGGVKGPNGGSYETEAQVIARTIQVDNIPDRWDAERLSSFIVEAAGLGLNKTDNFANVTSSTIEKKQTASSLSIVVTDKTIIEPYGDNNRLGLIEFQTLEMAQKIQALPDSLLIADGRQLIISNAKGTVSPREPDNVSFEPPPSTPVPVAYQQLTKLKLAEKIAKVRLLADRITSAQNPGPQWGGGRNQSNDHPDRMSGEGRGRGGRFSYSRRRGGGSPDSFPQFQNFRYRGGGGRFGRYDDYHRNNSYYHNHNDRHLDEGDFGPPFRRRPFRPLSPAPYRRKRRSEDLSPAPRDRSSDSVASRRRGSRRRRGHSNDPSRSTSRCRSSSRRTARSKRAPSDVDHARRSSSVESSDSSRPRKRTRSLRGPTSSHPSQGGRRTVSPPSPSRDRARSKSCRTARRRGGSASSSSSSSVMADDTKERRRRSSRSGIGFGSRRRRVGGSLSRSVEMRDDKKFVARSPSAADVPAHRERDSRDSPKSHREGNDKRGLHRSRSPPSFRRSDDDQHSDEDERRHRGGRERRSPTHSPSNRSRRSGLERERGLEVEGRGRRSGSWRDRGDTFEGRRRLRRDGGSTERRLSNHYAGEIYSRRRGPFEGSRERLHERDDRDPARARGPSKDMQEDRAVPPSPPSPPPRGAPTPPVPPSMKSAAPDRKSHISPSLAPAPTSAASVPTPAPTNPTSALLSVVRGGARGTMYADREEEHQKRIRLAALAKEKNRKVGGPGVEKAMSVHSNQSNEYQGHGMSNHDTSSPRVSPEASIVDRRLLELKEELRRTLKRPFQAQQPITS